MVGRHHNVSAVLRNLGHNRYMKSEGYVFQHTLFERETMLPQSDARAWHNHPGMVVIMPDVDKKALHRELPGLPLPSKLLARRALLHLESLPVDYGRIDMFHSVTNLMHDIADRQPDSWRGAEAAIFAQHFEDQKAFFGGALNKQQENDLDVDYMNVINLADHAQSGIEKSPMLLTSASVEVKKAGRADSEPSEDCVLVDDIRGIYGVFDGLGGNGGDLAVAAAVARDAIASSLANSPKLTSLNDMELTMRAAFDYARDKVMRNGREGSTTAVVAWRTYLDGQDYWVLGNAGDSRSYMYDRSNDEFRSLTSNQGYGPVVTNCFESGFWGRNGNNRADEFMIAPFSDEHRLMLCSDGITGDTDQEMLTEVEFLEAFSRPSVFESAATFVECSTKIDDKSVIVIDGR